MFNKMLKFVKRHDTILYILGLVVVGLLLIGIFNVYACSGEDCKSDGNVMYSGSANQGDILVFNCQKNDKSNTNIGNWVDPSFLKGEKGDIGLQGEQGISGLNGLDGYTPIKGVDYFDGINGIDGKDGLSIKGDTGEQGIQGFIGEQGIKGIQGLIGNTGNTGEQGIQGVQGVQGKTGVKGDKGDKGDRGLRGKGLENQQKAGIELRVFDTKRTTFSVYMNNDFSNKVTETGVKLTIKLGTSYEEREIAKTNKRLDRLEATIGTSPVIERVVDTKGKVKSISISANGLNVNGKF